MDNAEGRLRPGLRVEFSIILSERPNVLSVPMDSVQGDPADRVVYIADFDLPNAFIRSSVVLGERNDRYVEILSGVFPGDEVVTSGSYLLGYAGGGSGISLKEALDAAHGHEHNEDGSEITPEQRAQRAGEDHGHDHHDHDDHHGHEDDHGHDDHHGEGSTKVLIGYAIVSTLLWVGLAQALWNQRRKAKE